MTNKTLDRLNIFISMLIFRFQSILEKRMGNGPKNRNHWDDPASNYAPKGLKIYWETLPEIKQYQNECVSGHPDKSMTQFTLDYIKKSIGTSGLKGLSIGCSEGIGAPELFFFRSGFFENFDVFDIATELLKKQNKIAHSNGYFNISYIQTDLNSIELEKESYDFIWALGTVHHLHNLNQFYEQINMALKENGIFVMREYVGPNRLQYSDKQLSHINRILKKIPLKYRLRWNLLPKTKVRKIDPKKLIIIDPSEAICSELVAVKLEEYLDTVIAVETGGTILQPLLEDIAFNFEWDIKAKETLNELIQIEKDLITSGELPSDYVFYIAKKRKSDRRIIGGN